MDHPTAVWDLWTLRALMPDAEFEDLAELKARKLSMLAREREALAGLWTGDQRNLAPGRRFLVQNPELQSGLVVSFHQGPYHLLAEPFLAADLKPAVLLNPSARAPFQDFARRMKKIMGHKGEIQWITVGEPSFVRDLFRVIRQGRPVLVYLDGNSGHDGMDGTRKNGMLHSLPGRDIRVRTGLARLACRLQCPVHPVALHWNEKTELVWEKQRSQHWTRRDDPRRVTRLLFDWCFSEVLARPCQWDQWTMLRQASACFSPTLGQSARVPAGLREDFIHAFNVCLDRSSDSVRLHLDRQVEVWPGDVLADLTEDRFYPAEGLRDEDLQELRESSPTLGQLGDHHGLQWVKFHALRLCLLGMARLGA